LGKVVALEADLARWFFIQQYPFYTIGDTNQQWGLTLWGEHLPGGGASSPRFQTIVPVILNEVKNPWGAGSFPNEAVDPSRRSG
jgi:hypothetical protein